MTDESSSITSPEARVSGVVRFRDGVPAEGYRVKAFDRGLDEDRELGSGRTRPGGAFDIQCTPSHPGETKEETADIVVKVFDDNGLELVASRLFPAASPFLTVQLQIERSPGRLSEYDDLCAALAPKLRGRSPANLTPANIDYLAAVTGKDAEKIQLLVQSARCRAAFTENPAEVLPESVFYAWLSEGLPTVAVDLLAVPRVRLTQALERAQATGVVAAPSEETIESLRVANAALALRSSPLAAARASSSVAWPALLSNIVQHSRVEAELAPTQPGRRLTVFDLFTDRPVTVAGRAAVSPADLVAAKQRALAESLEEREGRWTTAAQSLEALGFDRVEQASIERSFALADLTDQHLPLVRALRDIEPIDRASPSGSLAYLALLDASQWRALVHATGMPHAIAGDADADAERTANYAELLGQRIEASYRTAVLAARIAQKTFDFREDRLSALVTFFRLNPKFEFGRDFVATYLTPSEPDRLTGIRDPLALMRDLLSLERTIKLTESHRHQAVLLEKGFNSAQRIVKYGRRDFVNQLGAHSAIGKNKAEAIFGKAEQVASTALHLALKHRATGHDPALMARQPDQIARSAAVNPRGQAIPDLETLFGSLDGTLGDPCLSVLSPSAYYAELLHFLDNRKLPTPIGTLDHVVPSDGAIFAVRDDQTDYTLQIFGNYTVSGVSTFALTYLMNTGQGYNPARANAGQIGSFGGAAPNSTAAEAKYSVLLTTDINGERIILSRVDRSLVVVRYPVTGFVGVAAPSSAITCERTDVSFKCWGYCNFDGSEEFANIGVFVTSSIYKLSDSRTSSEIRADVTFPPNRKDGTFECRVPFGAVNFSGDYQGTLTARIFHQPPGQARQQLAEWQVFFSIAVQSSSPNTAFLRALTNSISDVAAATGTEVQASPVSATVSPELSGDSALDILLRRRPDLVHIELSCANSDTELPYVDLLLEVLENAVAVPFPVGLTVADSDVNRVTTSLDASAIDSALASELVKRLSVRFTDQALVDVVAKSSNWQLADAGFRLSIGKVERQFTIEWIVPQTSDQPKLLLAQAEHFNPAAYEVLRGAGYPWSLPFDSAAAQARTFLSHLGTNRGVLIETFYQEVTDPNPEFGSLSTANFVSAAERWGFTPAELGIISGARTGTGEEGDPDSGPWNFWGLHAADLGPRNSIPDPANTGERIRTGRWAAVLSGRIDVLLQQSGLKYDELREVLDMRFVNTYDDGQWIVQIELGQIDLDATANPRKTLSSDLALAKLSKVVRDPDANRGAAADDADPDRAVAIISGALAEQVDAAIAVSRVPGSPPLGTNLGDAVADDPDMVGVLVRMHRFVRLWRHIGWSMHDLDQCIAFVPRLGGTRWPVLDADFIGSLDRTVQISQGQFHRSEKFLQLEANNQYRDFAAAGEPPIQTFYEKLFLNKSIADPPPPAFQLNGTRSEVVDANVAANDHLSHIAAACGISLQDAALLLDWLGESPRLGLATLSSVLWGAMIARAARIPVKDLLDLYSLLSRNGLSSLWSDPQTEMDTPAPVELGLKFQSTIVGEISSLRFWNVDADRKLTHLQR